MHNMFMELPDDNDQNDSGMESLTASKDDTPERRPEDHFVTPVLGTSPTASVPPYIGLKEYDDWEVPYARPVRKPQPRPVRKPQPRPMRKQHPLAHRVMMVDRKTGQVIGPVPDWRFPRCRINLQVEVQLEEYFQEPDETLSERLWGLTEMFPDCVRNSTYSVSTKTWSGVKNLYQLSRSVMWIVASSSVILFAPVIFEVERAQVEEMQKSQQKQVLLGTNTAMSGPMPSLPPMPR